MAVAHGRWQRARSATRCALRLCCCSCAGITLSAQRGGGPPAGGPAHPAIGNPRGDRRRREALQRNVHGVPRQGRHRRRARSARRLAEPPLSAPHGQRDLRHDQERDLGHADAAVLAGSSPTIRSGASRRTFAGFAAPPSTRRRRADVAGGEAIFWGKGTCGGCHMVKAKGGILGPDLSNLGGTAQSAEHRRRAHQGATTRFAADGGTHDTTLLPMTTYQPVRVTTRTGRSSRAS